FFRKKEVRPQPQGEPMELSRFPFVFAPDGSAQVAAARLEETIDVYWNDYPDHSRYCIARRFQRRRRRSVLWHRLLRRRRPRPDHRHSADPAIAGEDLIRTLFSIVRHSG